MTDKLSHPHPIGDELFFISQTRIYHKFECLNIVDMAAGGIVAIPFMNHLQNMPLHYRTATGSTISVQILARNHLSYFGDSSRIQQQFNRRRL